MRVAGELIPALEAEGDLSAAKDLDRLDDEGLADALEARAATVVRWKEIYREEFIPFAHGVRQLGRFYNDAVCPADPCEFVGLLQGERMIASRRNAAVAATPAPSAGDLERRLLEAVGPERHDEAREILALGRLKWRLHDDDNLLVGRLEGQLLRALAIAATRLCASGRLRTDAGVTPSAVPVLAAAVVERRGGMLIHGAIIARELGIPCVNGIADAIDRVANGELLIVDGYLGIVTVGTPDFDLERRLASGTHGDDGPGPSAE